MIATRDTFYSTTGMDTTDLFRAIDKSAHFPIANTVVVHQVSWHSSRSLAGVAIALVWLAYISALVALLWSRRRS